MKAVHLIRMGKMLPERQALSAAPAHVAPKDAVAQVLDVGSDSPEPLGVLGDILIEVAGLASGVTVDECDELVPFVMDRATVC
jgi:hypothetical protein